MWEPYLFINPQHHGLTSMVWPWNEQKSWCSHVLRRAPKSLCLEWVYHHEGVDLHSILLFSLRFLFSFYFFSLFLRGGPEAGVHVSLFSPFFFTLLLAWSFCKVWLDFKTFFISLEPMLEGFIILLLLLSIEQYCIFYPLMPFPISLNRKMLHESCRCEQGMNVACVICFYGHFTEGY